MHYYDAEGEYNPSFDPASLAALHACDEHDCTRGNWGGLIDEAQAAIRLTLDEMAVLAGTVTAETVTHHYTPSAPVRSAYSLLLEPALFRFPS